MIVVLTAHFTTNIVQLTYLIDLQQSRKKNVREKFGHYKIVLLTNLKKGCFTVSAKDNIDKNITANFVQSHFHSTGTSLFQLLDHENQGKSLDCHGFIDAV